MTMSFQDQPRTFLKKISEKLSNGRELYALCRNAGLSPRQARFLTKGLRTAINPAEVFARRRKLHHYFSGFSSPITIQEDTGYCLFHASQLPSAYKAFEAAKAIFDIRHALEGRTSAKGKTWRHDLLTPELLRQNREIIDFALSPEVVGTAAQYLGALPVLGTINIWWTEANESTESAQMWHVDQEDYRQAKLFINLSDVGPDNGPVTFMPAPATQRILKSAREPFKRVKDDEVTSSGEIQNIVTLTGAPGSAAFVDTSRCLHFGSRTRAGERGIIVFNYHSFPAIQETHDRTVRPANFGPAGLPLWAADLLTPNA